MTRKQRKEIEFLKKTFGVSATPKQEEEYLAVSVLGKGSGKISQFQDNQNPLLQAKRRLDINIKMWREDLTKGLLAKEELIEDFNYEYGTRLVNSILKSVTRDHRFNILSRGEATALAFTNFNLCPRNQI